MFDLLFSNFRMIVLRPLLMQYYNYLFGPTYLTKIGGRWLFGSRTFGLQRLKNKSVHHEILLLQNFTDILGKVLKPKKKNQPPTSEKNESVFLVF